MEQRLFELASRVRELREVCGYTVESMASELNVDMELYAAYEKTGENIPINVIFHIANICSVDFTELLTGESGKLTTYQLVKKGEGKNADRYPGYHFKDLAYRYSHKVMQPLMVTLDPSLAPAALVSHGGQEFNMVVAGQMKLIFGETEMILSEGDSIYFNPQYPHGQFCVGDEPATFLTVIAE